MTGGRRRGAPRGPSRVRLRLAEAEAALRAVRRGEVDAVVVEGEDGPRVFTLEGAESVYRVLIESMNEGAVTLAANQVILYANRCFARMVDRPMEQVMGSPLRLYLSDGDQAKIRPLLRRPDRAGSKVQVLLVGGAGRRVPAQISIRPLPGRPGQAASVGFVVTDMTEARRSEDLLRSLAHRVVEAQEAERRRVALELHDRVTQPLCAVLFRSQAFARGLPARDGPARREAARLQAMIGEAASTVERISHGLRPGTMDELGLVAVLRGACREFAARTGVPVRVACAALPAGLPAGSELALFRVLQEALRNVEQHARARGVAVELTRPRRCVQLSIADDGTGFEPDRPPAGAGEGRGLGLVSMHERAAHLGGTLKVLSSPGKGTIVRARLPIRTGAGEGNGSQADRAAPRPRRGPGARGRRRSRNPG